MPVNYLLTSVIVALMARTLPMPPADASVTATLASFAIFAVIALAIFMARSTARIWLWMIGSLLVLGGALWLSFITGARL